MEQITCVYIRTLSRTTGDNPRSTILIEYLGDTFNLNLWSPWHSIVDGLEPYTKLIIYNIKKISTDSSPYFSAGSDSIVVVDPDILINATDISPVSFCPRSYYLSQIVGDQAPPYTAVRGTIVHNCLSQAVSSGDSPSKVLPNVLDSFSLHYETLNYDRDRVHKEVQPMTEALDAFVNSLPSTSGATPELLFLSPAFGIRGRIDLLVGNHIYELKTAKRVTEDKIRFSDLVQVSVYSYGSANTIEKSKEISGSVLYVGSNELVTKEVLPTKEILRYAIQMRNLAYRISYLGYVPPILQLTQGRRCESCSMRFVCLMVCAKLNQQRTCSSCPHNDFCTKESLPKNQQDYFNHFTELLRLEKNEWSRNLADLWNLDVNQRVARGRAIKDLELINTYSENGRSYHLFSCKNNSEIREGDIVLLSNGDILNNQLTSGKVSRVDEDFIEIETHGLQSSVSVVDIYSIDVNFRRQQRGIYNIIFKNNNYKQYLIDNIEPKITIIDGTFIKNNKTQNEAIAKILGTEGYCLIQGPAGTGKTHVIARSAIILANSNRRVLITAFTNRAVDNVCKYLLANQFFSFVRLGDTHAIDRELRDYTIESHKKRFNEKSALNIIKEIPVIVATTSTISNPLFESLDIDIVIVDEASQMTEPNVLSALIGGSALILVGDHKQLPPVVQNPQAHKKGLSISLFERLAKHSPSNIHLLDLQFRMNDKLMEFSNLTFYEGKLKSYDNLVKHQNLLDLGNFTSDYYNFSHKEIYDPKNPLVFIMANGTFDPEKKMNVYEAKIIGDVTTNFLRCGINSDQIGIIAPFRGQVGEIRRHVPATITVDTVDRFQGTDREIIILSITETHPSPKRGLGDERRLNVAITRAKKKLVVVGSDTIDEGTIGEYVSYLKENATTVSMKKEKHKEIIRYTHKTLIVADNISKTARFIKKVKIASKKLANGRKHKNICMICFQPVYENAVECPMCGTMYHFDHLVKWIKENERCPYCKTSLILLSV